MLCRGLHYLRMSQIQREATMISDERGLPEFEGNLLLNTGAAKRTALAHRDAQVVRLGADLD